MTFPRRKKYWNVFEKLSFNNREFEEVKKIQLSFHVCVFAIFYFHCNQSLLCHSIIMIIYYYSEYFILYLYLILYFSLYSVIFLPIFIMHRNTINFVFFSSLDFWRFFFPLSIYSLYQFNCDHFTKVLPTKWIPCYCYFEEYSKKSKQMNLVIFGWFEGYKGVIISLWDCYPKRFEQTDGETSELKKIRHKKKSTEKELKKNVI